MGTRQREQAQRRRWADIVVIATGLYAFLTATFGPNLLAPEQAAATVRDPLWLLAGTAAAGILALAAVFIALRSAGTARIMTGAAGLVLLISLFNFREIGWFAVASLIAPGLVLIAAAPFMGPMPAPEEEGEER